MICSSVNRIRFIRSVLLASPDSNSMWGNYGGHVTALLLLLENQSIHIQFGSFVFGALRNSAYSLRMYTRNIDTDDPTSYTGILTVDWFIVAVFAAIFSNSLSKFLRKN